MKWLRGKQREHSIVLYTKAGCHLCVEADALIHKVAERQPLSLQKVDIEDDPAMYERFKYTIPVVEIDERVQLEWPFDEAMLRRTLEML